MGRDMLISFVEIEHDKKPNFKKAAAVLKKLDAETLQHAIEIATGNEHCEAQDARNRIEKALENTVAGWNDNLRMMVKCRGLATTLLIAADGSWGDSVEECDDLNLFAESGLAEAAGFLTKPVKIIVPKPKPWKKKAKVKRG